VSVPVHSRGHSVRGHSLEGNWQSAARRSHAGTSQRGHSSSEQRLHPNRQGRDFPENTRGSGDGRRNVPGPRSPPAVGVSGRNVAARRKGGEAGERETAVAVTVTLAGDPPTRPPAPHLLRAGADVLSGRLAPAPPPKPGPRRPGRRPGAAPAPAPVRGPARSRQRQAGRPRPAEAARRSWALPAAAMARVAERRDVTRTAEARSEDGADAEGCGPSTRVLLRESAKRSAGLRVTFKLGRPRPAPPTSCPAPPTSCPAHAPPPGLAASSGAGLSARSPAERSTLTISSLEE
jgi:hypothetical protein